MRKIWAFIAGIVVVKAVTARKNTVPTEPTESGTDSASFERAILRVQEAEGGYQNLYNDRGNWTGCKIGVGTRAGTNYGISACFYKSFTGITPSAAIMKALTWPQAKAIYKDYFWANIQGDKIKNQFVADIFMDGHVNHGYTGIKLMQEVLGVAKDGIVGPITLAAINAQNPAVLYVAYRERRRAFYYLLAQNPDNAGFLQGWLNRLKNFKDY